MKQIIIFAIVTILLTSTAVMANPAFGVKAGLNFSSASISPLDNGITKKSIIGFLVGGTVETPLSQDKSFGFRGEVSWTEKGAKLQGDNGSMKETVDELDLSPFLVYNISGLIDDARPFVQAGPELGFVLSSNQHIEIDNQGTKDQEDKNIASTDFSLNLGAGIGLPLKNKGEVVFDVRYCIGLTDMDDTSEGSSKLRGFLLNVGYNFPPKK